jgi:hypothetical protein
MEYDNSLDSEDVMSDVVSTSADIRDYTPLTNTPPRLVLGSHVLDEELEQALQRTRTDLFPKERKRGFSLIYFLMI